MVKNESPKTFPEDPLRTFPIDPFFGGWGASGSLLAPRGFGRPVDKYAAAGYFKQAAERSFVPAMLRLVDMLTRGDGVEKNPEAGLPSCIVLQESCPITEKKKKNRATWKIGLRKTNEKLA